MAVLCHSHIFLWAFSALFLSVADEIHVQLNGGLNPTALRYPYYIATRRKHLHGPESMVVNQAVQIRPPQIIESKVHIASIACSSIHIYEIGVLRRLSNGISYISVSSACLKKVSPRRLLFNSSDYRIAGRENIVVDGSAGYVCANLSMSEGKGKIISHGYWKICLYPYTDSQGPFGIPGELNQHKVKSFENRVENSDVNLFHHERCDRLFEDLRLLRA
ncbi:hypothetical protein CPC08DRAFT_724879 [Agrocybe pediades]|nr:hypothetical protein CPC08DRAFT_724879 [Agrocybe pediades]